MNLNREQIIKALECCKSPKLTKCGGCPREEEDGHCMYRLNEDALSLIKELTEENESLKTQRRVLAVGLKDMRKEIRDIKADTVRKMHSEIEARCIKGGIYPAFVKSTIDQIAKEMMEDENATN